MNTTKLLGWLGIAIVCCVPLLALAQITVPDFVQGDDAASQVNKVARNAALLLYAVAGAVAVIGLIIGAIQWMDDREAEAKQRIRNVIIGGSLIAIVGAIVHIFA